MPEWNVVTRGTVVGTVQGDTYSDALAAAREEHGDGVRVSGVGNPNTMTTRQERAERQEREKRRIRRERDDKGRFS